MREKPRKRHDSYSATLFVKNVVKNEGRNDANPKLSRCNRKIA